MPSRTHDIRLNYLDISLVRGLVAPQRTRTLIRYRTTLDNSLSGHLRHQNRPLHDARTSYNGSKSSHHEAVLEAFKKSFGRKTVTCKFSDLWKHAKGHTAEPVRLFGYLGERSDLSKRLSFATLVDPTQCQQIQIVSAPSKDKIDELHIHEHLKAIRANTPVYVEGYVRTKKNKSTEPRETDEIDITGLELSLSGPATKIESLNDFPSDIIMKPDTEFPSEQRHLQLRNSPDSRHALVMRARIQENCRTYLRESAQALEIETPILFKSTSEGAREFLVPTRRKGYAYALPQSPQQFKQLLMSSGMYRYFQFARCFRDEDLRADRQPEFTQLDIEMSFANGEDVMDVVEHTIIKPLWKSILSIDMPVQFPRKTYAEVMAQYGSDKPDLRIPVRPFTSIGHVIPADLTSMITPLIGPIVEAMVFPMDCTPEKTKIFARDYFDSPEGKVFNANPDGGPGVFVYDSRKPLQGLSAFGFEAVENLERDLHLEDGFLVIIQARKDLPPSGGSTSLGNLRNGIWNAAIRGGQLCTPSWQHFEPLWITDFPLFSPVDSSEPGQGGNAGFASTHHPFTSPKTPEDVDLLIGDPTKVIGYHYDLVINGEEIGGGSQRIHQAAMQKLIFQEILMMDDEKVKEFDHLLEALRAGCPPHAGIALGFDRLVAMLVSSKLEKRMTMRDVIAFPKSGKGDDPTVKSPGLITDEVLEPYHLNLLN